MSKQYKWSNKEIQCVIDNYNYKTCKQLAKELNMSKYAVFNKAHQLNITKDFHAQYIGHTYNKLTILKYHHKDKHGLPHYLCQCSCGKKKIIALQSIKSGYTKLCGCYHQ